MSAITAGWGLFRSLKSPKGFGLNSLPASTFLSDGWLTACIPVPTFALTAGWISNQLKGSFGSRTAVTACFTASRADGRHVAP
eukprot:3980394-Prymnesium_polylepis.2